QLIATLSSAATSFMDTDLRGSTQYAYAINTLGAADVGRFDALTRSGPVDFLQYVKVKRETAAPDLQWVNKADLWGHNAEGLYGISLNFFGPDGHRDTDLRIDISTDGINYTPLITLPRNEMVYYANNLAQGQYYSFKLTPIDDFGAVDGAARTIEVDSLNFHPVANDDDVVSTTTPVVISPLANDSDWDGDTLTITAFTQGDHGTVTQVGNQLTYNPTSGNFTPDEFTYTVSDGFGGEATGTVRVTITQQGSLGIFTSNRDIGSPARAGSSFESGGVYTVIGGGTDIWQTSDQFQYVYRDMSGDVEIIARIDYLEDVHEWSKGGLMIRNGTGANAAHAMVQIRPDGNASFQWRDAAGASAGYGGVTGGTSMPKWLRLVRSGNTFRAYYSFDGANWTQISSSRNINMANSVQVGLAVTSHDNGELATAQFSNVSIPSLPTLAGDYNLDGVVDTDDYMVWRNNFGQTGTNPADGNNNGIVDSADYTIWRDNLGATLAPPAAEETLQPEQTTSNPTAQPEGDVETDSANEHAVVSSTDSEQEQAKPTRCELLQDRQKRREARQERTSVRVLERIRKQTVRQASVLDEQSAAVAMLWWNRLQDADDDDRKRLRKR
ncbi:MAG: Ig-like domain-containing protein, partial [Rhodospirillales bacterium]|nr:Ig-like domain-containing protein [Rhodospirillales bacterium]